MISPRGIVRWLGRRAILYVALVAAIGLATFAVPWIRREVAGGTVAQTRHLSLLTTSERMDREIGVAVAASKARAGSMRGQGVRALDARITVLERQQVFLRGQVAEAPPRWRLALGGADAVLAVERARLSLLIVDAELSSLHAARDLAILNARAVMAAADADARRSSALSAISSCNRARNARAAFERRWRWRIRSWFDNADHRALTAAQADACADARRKIAAYNAVARTRRDLAAAQREAEQKFGKIPGSIDAPVAALRSSLAADLRRAEVEWRGSLGAKARLWADRLHVRAILWQAAGAFVVILITPYAIRLFCYFVLAPIAMRRPVIRIHAPAGSAIMPPAARSQTSVGIRLAAGHELLVRQDYLQTTSHGGAKGTQWFLDWSHPVTSLAARLTFLTRIRGEGEVTTISAVRDPFAEVTVLQIPEQAACVLQPRALAAIVQPVDRPLRVSTHWRLTSLNAWLTLQLRYIVFHGPAQLVLKGGRGVRIEASERGRVFGQAQLIGFSADLAYSVTRTETFWPYLLGREQLLKDRVEGGSGILILEEAPGARWGRGEVKHGIEGMIDAALKVFGL